MKAGSKTLFFHGVSESKLAQYKSREICHEIQNIKAQTIKGDNPRSELSIFGRATYARSKKLRI
jgi:hypothetical protein